MSCRIFQPKLFVIALVFEGSRRTLDIAEFLLRNLLFVDWCSPNSKHSRTLWTTDENRAPSAPKSIRVGRQVLCLHSKIHKLWPILAKFYFAAKFRDGLSLAEWNTAISVSLKPVASQLEAFFITYVKLLIERNSERNKCLKLCSNFVFVALLVNQSVPGRFQRSLGPNLGWKRNWKEKSGKGRGRTKGRKRGEGVKEIFYCLFVLLILVSSVKKIGCVKPISFVLRVNVLVCFL